MTATDAAIDRARAALQALVAAHGHWETAFAAEHGIGVSEVRALSAVTRLGGPTHREVAEDVGLTRSGTTAVLDRLETLGHLVPNPADRRSVTLRATRAGRRLAAALALGHADALHALPDDFDLERVAEGLVAMAEAIDARAARLSA
jgi:DNA-binding MarR family transcriptional regulator